jgi:hypothetical protein
MAQAQALQDILIPMSKAVHAVISRLVSEADGLMIQAADEKEKGEHVTKREVVYKVPGLEITTYGEKGSGTSSAAPAILPSQVIDGVTRKRNCGLCGLSTPYPHRKKNCPNAHLVQVGKKAEVEARPTKKKREMKPLTEEQKEQRRATLVKARAARGKK